MTIKYNRWQLIIGYILLIGLVGLVVWTAVKSWFLFWSFIAQSNPTVGAAIIAGSITFLISTLTLIWTRHSDKQKDIEVKRKEIEQEHRQAKIPAYTEFVEFLFKLFNAQRTNVSMPLDDVIKAMQDFTKKILIWGSDSIIKDYTIFSEYSISIEERKKNGEIIPQVDTMKTMLLFEKLLYDIRADLGHDNKGLGECDLLTLFVNDIREEQKKYKLSIRHP
jgi:hypothetical protein